MAAMLGIPASALGLKDSDYVSIEWKGADSLVASLREMVEKRRSAFAAITAKLAAANLLAPTDVPGLHLQIYLNIHDSRDDRHESLPDRATLARELSVDVAPY